MPETPFDVMTNSGYFNQVNETSNMIEADTPPSTLQINPRPTITTFNDNVQLMPQSQTFVPVVPASIHGSVSLASESTPDIMNIPNVLSPTFSSSSFLPPLELENEEIRARIFIGIDDDDDDNNNEGVRLTEDFENIEKSCLIDVTEFVESLYGYMHQNDNENENENENALFFVESANFLTF